MDSIPVKVSGNIINELSEKVPSYMFAINEVLKNSYDACATEIKITYDLDSHVLKVHDNGHGMSEKNLQSLFHIAQSNKTYGKLVCGNRYQQGEKGLGLLAVFKFGNLVKWKTTHESYNGTLNFEVNKSDLAKLDDITGFDLPVTSLENKNDFKGTLVSIECTQDDEQIIINKFFTSDINTKKFTNLFLDDGIDVTFKLFKGSKSKNQFNTTSLTKAMERSKNLCIFNVEFDSKNNSSIIFRIGNQTKKTEFKKKKLPHNISVKADLRILSLKGSGVKNVDSLFHLVRSKQSSLRPLVYFNKVLFNNYELFNPEISRGVQSSKSLPQIIGYLDLIVTNPKITFNPDRTKLIENLTVSELEDYLLELNLFIQEEASKLRRNGFPKSDNPSESESSLKPDNPSEPDSSLKPDNPSESDSSFAINKIGVIKLNKTKSIINFYHYSPTLNLLDFIKSAYDSNNYKVNNDSISVYIDGIESIDKCISDISNSNQKIIVYKFFENSKPVVSSELKLIFNKKTPALQSTSNEEALIKSFSFEYEISLPIVGELIQQINALWSTDKSYKIIITTSLRVIFELCCKYLEDYDSDFPFKKGLEDKVHEAVTYIKLYKGQNSKFYNNLSNSFNTYNNYFNPDDFKSKVKKSNLGSHGATDKLCKDDIETIAEHAGYFAQLVDAYLKDKGYI